MLHFNPSLFLLLHSFAQACYHQRYSEKRCIEASMEWNFRNDSDKKTENRRETERGRNFRFINFSVVEITN